MAKIPIISVPEAPMADASLAPAPMVKPPTERYQEATNFEKHIPGLMQKELDPRPFQARAAAQMGIGKTLVRTGSEFIDLSFAMQRSKDSSDISRVKLLNANVLEQFNEKVAANNIPLSQQAALWQGEFEPKIDDHIAQLRPSGGVLDRIALENDTFKRGTRANIWDRANKEQIKSDFEAMESDYKMSLEEGDYEGAGEAV